MLTLLLAAYCGISVIALLLIYMACAMSGKISRAERGEPTVNPEPPKAPIHNVSRRTELVI
jgi:hypothetical protein